MAFWVTYALFAGILSDGRRTLPSCSPCHDSKGYVLKPAGAVVSAELTGRPEQMPLVVSVLWSSCPLFPNPVLRKPQPVNIFAPSQ